MVSVSYGDEAKPRLSIFFLNKLDLFGFFGCAGSSLLCRAFSCCRAQALGHEAFSSCSSRALEHRLNSCGSPT